MVDHIKNRDAVVRALREELYGPSPQGPEIDCEGDVVLPDFGQAFGPYRQTGSGEEILLRDPPLKRYGVGVLYPSGLQPADDPGEQSGPLESEPLEKDNDSALTDRAAKSLDKLAKELCVERAGREDDDLDLSGTGSLRPSTMAVSFLARFPPDSELIVKVTGGRYVRKEITAGGRKRTWWLRRPIRLAVVFSGDSLLASSPQEVHSCNVVESHNLADLDLRVRLFARPRSEADMSLLTVCLANQERAGQSIHGNCVFQVHFAVTVVCPEQRPLISPYPVPPPRDEEEESFELLFRDRLTFAVGHGCAADWIRGDGDSEASSVSAEALPLHETPNITPDVHLDNGQPLSIPMAPLAGLIPDDDGFTSLKNLVYHYDSWILRQAQRTEALPARLQNSAARHLAECRRAANRMREGLAFLQDPAHTIELTAFRMANKALLIQQLRQLREARPATFDSNSLSITFADPYPQLDLSSPDSLSQSWWAFQIAFLLMSIPSVALGADPCRRTVELIWFSTGGGKTEAYLGLAAFSAFLRRLRDPRDDGVDVLMRYTLRLLTTQQFQRASRLICAMEYLRRSEDKDLGDTPFTIGLWVGDDSTPNLRSSARTILKGLEQRDRVTLNKFVLDKCPWCGAQMGPLKLKVPRRQSRLVNVIGYERLEDTVAFRCPDRQCEFTNGIPVYVIDEDIYERRPTIVIGTVDKFATLAWRPAAKVLFGVDNTGIRVKSPPGLIIQDELHLISGPLGSMVGLYEAVIEELCTDNRADPPVPPKLVSSTATIRSYRRQVHALYCRTDVVLFPPPALDADDSFFGQREVDNTGRPVRGRIFVGVHAPSLGSMQTVQVRTFTALLLAPKQWEPAAQDPWWTLMVFFNSLRELGTTISLFQADVPDYFKVIRSRLGLAWASMRRLWHMLELTGRRSGEEIPKAISELERSCGGRGYPVDVCLASNIIEVGIDIDRLSLLCVVGQPKTTSQYIQVTGRVGREATRPGLIVTLYGATKPRDRSHFEKFRSYHERLYAQVEPTSVTPFSLPALERALHGVLVSYVRQAGDQDVADSPYPYPSELVEQFCTLLESRVREIDEGELANFERVMHRRCLEWKAWERLKWSGHLHADDMPLLYHAGIYVTPENARVSWATPTSMRNVDAECQVEITRQYALNRGEVDA